MHKLYKLIKFGRTNINTRDYWNNEWANDSVQRDYVELFKLILEQIPTGVKVLDVGCGVGRLSKIIREQKNADLTCLDFSDWACEQLEKEGFKTIVSKLPNIPLPDNAFDIAVATEVFEHLDNPEKTIKQMVRVVKPGGIIMCSVPNDALHPHEELEHQHLFTFDKIVAMLSKYRNEIITKTGKLYLGSEHKFILAI
ncbi:class I SAM-dependent methyltransferase [Candidatus Methylomicrobium oryzae]|uniref:class I SAM-dependent methyltransferase n=1 Tax=Candidatus Methylomicrobium oryzae TaxID=2802053 RepID=UPI0019245667|nr:class I SAM-dependent methyltransferase [Methylomicrobium sp. RS1]MBL1264997.1 class I SAM-dependent methyltransferase [Methylomicrobium sp. RS1]